MAATRRLPLCSASAIEAAVALFSLDDDRRMRMAVHL
jgi:hypothetical protein